MIAIFHRLAFFDWQSRILDPKCRFSDFRLTFSANSNPNSVSYKNYKNHKNLEANLRQLSEPPARQNRLSPYPWDYQLIYIKLMNHAYNQWPVSARTMIFLQTKLLGVNSSLSLIACGESSPKDVNNKDIDT